MRNSIMILAFLSLMVVPQLAFAGNSSDNLDAVAVTPAASAAAVTPPENEKEYTPKLTDKDPFRTLISPPPPVVPPQEKPKEIKPNRENIVEPLPVKVTFIVGTDIRRFANIVLNQKTYELTNGEDAEGGLFHVIEVGGRSVRIFDSRVRKERTIVLAE